MKNYVEVSKNYARSVVSGDIVSCRYVRLACERFLRDLEKTNWRWFFDEDRAKEVCVFVEHAIKHVKGPKAGEALLLEPWQIFILTNIYGWIDANKIRKHQYVVLEIARKNGKSLFASAMALYEMLKGEEGGAVSYTHLTLPTILRV